MNKTCSKCNIEKDINLFYKDSSKSGGYRKDCIACTKERGKKYYINNKEEALSRAKEYRELNRDVINKKTKEYHHKNKDKFYEKNKIYREVNKNKIKKIAKIYYQNNRDVILNKYYQNREESISRNKKWKQLNQDKVRQYRKEYRLKRISEDPLYRLKHNIRSLIRQCINKKGASKKSKTIQILGCSFEEFKQHIESKFEPWMSWENYGLYNGQPLYGWDIDHIKPSSLAQTIEEVYQLNHYSNLQPLCSYQNRDVKKDRFIEGESQ